MNSHADLGYNCTHALESYYVIAWLGAIISQIAQVIVPIQRTLYSGRGRVRTAR